MSVNRSQDKIWKGDLKMVFCKFAGVHGKIWFDPSLKVWKAGKPVVLITADKDMDVGV